MTAEPLTVDIAAHPAAARRRRRRRRRSAVEGVSQVFERGAAPVLAGVDLTVAPGRVRLPGRGVGLREVDAAQPGRRPDRPTAGRIAVSRGAAGADVPGAGAAARG